MRRGKGYHAAGLLQLHSISKTAQVKEESTSEKKEKTCGREMLEGKEARQPRKKEKVSVLSYDECEAQTLQ